MENSAQLINLVHSIVVYKLAKTYPLKGAAHKDVKRRLISEFGDNLAFYQKSKIQSEYVYYKTVPVEEDGRSCFFMNEGEKVKKVAAMNRAEIEKSCKSFSTWPPHPDKIDSNKVKIPELLDTFLKFLLTKTFPVSKRVQRLTKSLGARFDIQFHTWCSQNGQTSSIRNCDQEKNWI